MNPQKGQLKDIEKHYPNVNLKSVSIIAEGGNDNGETFLGSFLFEGKENGRTVKYKINND